MFILIGSVAGAAVLSVACCCGGVFWLGRKWTNEKEERLAPFQPYLAEFSQKPKLRRHDLDEPYVKEKVLPIDLGARQVDDDVLRKLPVELRPEKPEDVGTIALLEWRKEKAGEYEGGAIAYIWVCQVFLVDRSRKMIVGEELIEGEAKETTSEWKSEDTGRKPVEAIVKYLSSLPSG
jgi:hypothetical protein